MFLKLFENNYNRGKYLIMDKSLINTQKQVENSVSEDIAPIRNNTLDKIKKISKWAINKSGKLKSFKEQFNEFRNKELPSGVQLIVKDNSNSLQYANIKNNPIVTSQKTLNKFINDGKHNNIPLYIIENLVSELDNSVLAMESKTVPNSRIIVLDEYVGQKPVIVTMNLDKTNAKIEINEISSVYDKNDFQTLLNTTVEYNKTVYTNEKTEEWLIRNRLQLPTRFANPSASYDNNSTKYSKNQMAPLSSFNSMRQNIENITNNKK